MARKNSFVFISIALVAATVACSVLTRTPLSPGISSPTGGPASTGGPSTSSDFPLPPNPLTIKVTLDETLTFTSQAVPGTVGSGAVGLQTADGTTVNAGLFDQLVTQRADGTLSAALGTPVKMTAVSAIEGLPFSGGLLTAINLAPEGLLIVRPTLLSFKLPGSYSADQVAGFTSKGDGTEFHLVPIQVALLGGETMIVFHVSHFSIYGVALASRAEVNMQQSHAPTSPEDQIDQALAPLPASKQVVDSLREDYTKYIKPKIDNLNNLEGDCKYAVQSAQQFDNWYYQVKTAGVEGSFENEIKQSAAILYTSLVDCLKKSCQLCIGQGDASALEDMIVTTFYARDMERILNKNPEDFNWEFLANTCATKSGYHPPYSGEFQSDPGPNPEPTLIPTCP
jgi:hypothetical protein